MSAKKIAAFFLCLLLCFCSLLTNTAPAFAESIGFSQSLQADRASRYYRGDTIELLRNLLKQATLEERQTLASIVKSSNSGIDSIIDALQWNSQQKGMYWSGHRLSYREITEKVARAARVSHPKYYSTADIELAVTRKVLEDAWSNMTPVQRAEMEVELQKEAGKLGLKDLEAMGGMGIISSLLAAKASGFAVYTLATTSLAILTKTFGIVVPFAAYTGLTSAIAVVTGPIGWAGAGVFTAWQLAAPDMQRLTSAVVYICAIRARVENSLKLT